MISHLVSLLHIWRVCSWLRIFSDKHLVGLHGSFSKGCCNELLHLKNVVIQRRDIPQVFTLTHADQSSEKWRYEILYYRASGNSCSRFLTVSLILYVCSGNEPVSTVVLQHPHTQQAMRSSLDPSVGMTSVTGGQEGHERTWWQICQGLSWTPVPSPIHPLWA